MNFNSIKEAIHAIDNGEIIIVLDDHQRENEGDFMMATERVTSNSINFMATYGRGLICTPIKEELAIKLKLPSMVRSNESLYETAFTVSIDTVHGSTGISCQDRMLTMQSLIRENATADEFMRPGHVFPLVAKARGVLEREGHTEAAVDLATLAGLKSSGVICEIMNKDGTMARQEELFQVAKEHSLKIITIEDLKIYMTKRRDENTRR